MDCLVTAENISTINDCGILLDPEPTTQESLDLSTENGWVIIQDKEGRELGISPANLTITIDHIQSGHRNIFLSLVAPTSVKIYETVGTVCLVIFRLEGDGLGCDCKWHDAVQEIDPLSVIFADRIDFRHAFMQG